jgi:ribonuclease PH
VVLTGSGEYVELQGTAERAPFNAQMLDRLLRLAGGGARELVQIQRAVLDVERADVEPQGA